MLLDRTRIDYFYFPRGSYMQTYLMVSSVSSVRVAGSLPFSTWIQITYFLLHVDHEMFPLCWNVLLTASSDRLLKAYQCNPL